MAGMIQLTEYKEDEAGTPVIVAIDEIVHAREWKYHSFRPAISEIVLKSGQKIRVWDVIEVVVAKIKKVRGCL